MAEIYTMNGETITQGLQGSEKCDDAIRAAKAISMDIGETVRLVDDGEEWDVYPDGTITVGGHWDNDFDDV